MLQALLKIKGPGVITFHSLSRYFFGEGFAMPPKKIEGQVMKPGQEKLYPQGAVDDLPDWIKELVIKPIVEDGLVPEGWINSAVVNTYLPGACLVSHIDPLHIFKRPIISASFLSDTQLSFGCKFSSRSQRESRPVTQIPCKR